MTIFLSVLSAAALIGVPLSVWLIPLYWKLDAYEKAIRDVDDEIDAVEPRLEEDTNFGLVGPAQRQSRLDVEKAPLRRKLERLKQERQFIIDKLPFFKK